jgi:hypothetical protein
MRKLPNHRLWLRAGVALAALSQACGAPAPELATQARTSIVGGSPAGAAFPGVLWLETGCAATLLHEELIVYAAHCGVEHRRAWIADALELEVSDDGRSVRLQDAEAHGSVAIRTCVAHMDGGAGSESDIAFCVLEAPLSDVPVVLPVDGCEREQVGDGTRAKLVGFGFDSEDGSGLGTKRVAEGVISEEGGRLFVGDERAGTCSGDSGGPALVRIASSDGSGDEWRVLGVLSSGADTCGAGLYADVRNFIAWLGEHSGVRVSPCFDDSGTWSPSAACLAPALDEAGFATSDAPRFSSTCGPALTSGAALEKAPRPGGCALGVARSPAVLPIFTVIGAALVRRRLRPRAQRIASAVLERAC